MSHRLCPPLAPVDNAFLQSQPHIGPHSTSTNCCFYLSLHCIADWLKDWPQDEVRWNWWHWDPLLPHASHLPWVLLRRRHQPLKKALTSFSVSEGALCRKHHRWEGLWHPVSFASPQGSATLGVTQPPALAVLCNLAIVPLTHLSPPQPSLFQRWQQGWKRWC